ncbi:MAG: FAD-dependent oxidoreductase [Alcanivoracaceae bacterium]
MPLSRQRIAIIGAGTAGLAAAILLARQCHDVTLIERAPALTPVGAGLLLQPSGLRVMESMGLGHAMAAYGARIDALYGDTRSQRCIMRTKYSDLSAGLHGLGVHRASLCHVLDQALSAEPHQRWMDTAVQAIHQQGDQVVLDLQRAASSAAGEADQQAFDAVLVANGSASTLRPRELVRFDRQYPWGALWAILPQAAPFDEPRLQQRYDGSHTMIGLLPSGSTPHQPDQALVSFFWSMPVIQMMQWHQQPEHFHSWKESVLSLWPESSTVLAALTSPQQLIPASYRDVILKRWAQGRIGVIGDAAHAMSPQLGQGANMALMDARALADAVAQNSNWDDVWTHYHRQRGGMIRFYQSMSRLLTPIFQSRIPGAGWGRDMGFPLMNQLPWLSREMTRTVAGFKSGWFTSEQ